ncbi:AMP-binding protein [Amycolatopsis acidiphila]|uniref:class I adenylate-forming enzyme family protein n=1 Tax=Amycolatopsis acidiphila TaxID=715473 RepID=UPI001643A777|nr:AMP-binding protein [Amycolatopsis acidiphila]UIJ63375.1 AMP-binding protein [Amycolatopsis acidiphila]GHG75253.1 AMP-binding protein [Amycolatopsis acidiphila]
MNTPRTLAGAVENTAAAAPGRPALLYHGTTFSYHDLHAESCRAAKALLGLGVRRGDRVGVLLGNQPEWVVICLGAAQIGAVLVPLNTWYQSREIEWTLRHCGVTVLVSGSRFLKREFDRLLTDLIPELAAGEPGELRSTRLPRLRAVAMTGDPAPGAFSWPGFLSVGASVTDADLEKAAGSVTADDDMFVIYTSGSTADPKGVRLTHGGLLGNGAEVARRRWIDAEDRIWLGAPLFYGLGAANALPVALAAGAGLVLQDYFDPGVAIRTIRSTSATTYYGTGNMTRAILDHPTFSPGKVATLEKGTAGISRHYKSMTLTELGVRLATPAYGLTETYGHITGGLPDDPLDVKLDTDGAPLPGVEVQIVDPVTRRPLPPGERGLILLQGRVTPGYFDNPDETAKALRPDGFFDTGDLGHLDSAGRLVFHSRIKEVLKSNGVTISPAEIEQLLVSHPDVTDACVVGVPHPDRGELIVAFVTAKTPLKETTLRDYVRERAASFKVPHHVLVRDKDDLPRLASGKIAKLRLAEMAIAELTG